MAAINQDDASIYHSSVKSLLTHLYQISIWSILILNLPRDSGESSVLSLHSHICLETKEVLPYRPTNLACNVCPKTSVSHRLEKKIITITSPKKFNHRSSLSVTIMASSDCHHLIKMAKYDFLWFCVVYPEC